MFALINLIMQMSKDWKDAHFISQKKDVCQKSRKVLKLMRNKWIEIVNGVLKDNFEHVPLNVSINVADSLLGEGAILVDTNKVDFVTNRKPIQTALGMPLDELSSLIKAKEEGRIIVPPCKVGDTVYYPSFNIGMVLSYKVVSIKLNSKGLYIVLDSRLRNEQMTHRATQIGKTVFLTQEEAEKALKGGGE